MMVQKSSSLTEESAEVQVLLASLSKTKDLTRRIGTSLSRLDLSGQTVNDAIGPISRNTQKLQVTSVNIDKINSAIEKLRQPADAKGREEGIIRAGPQASGLKEYLAALRRIDRALSDLNATNLRANQQAVTEFRDLQTTGANQLLESYKSAVSEEDQVEPLNFVVKDGDAPIFSADKAQYVGEMIAAITSANSQARNLGQPENNQVTRIYIDARGEYLQLSLQNLATGCLNTTRRGRDDGDMYKAGDNAIGTYAKAIEVMFWAEYKNITRVFRGEDVPRAYSGVCAKPLATLSKTLSELNRTIREHIMSDCFLAYETVDILTAMSYRLEKQTGLPRSMISDASQPVRESARISITEQYNRVRGKAESMATLPPDGSTVPLVNETANRMVVLSDYNRSVSSILESIGDGSWRTTQRPESASAKQLTPQSTALSLPEGELGTSKLLSSYLGDMTDALLSGLANRSNSIHKAKHVQGVFMLNSIAVIDQKIKNSELLQRYLSSSRLEAYNKSAKTAYMSLWNDPIAQLFDTVNTSANRPLSGSNAALDSAAIIKSLSSKDKDKIKEKFRDFTVKFDDAVARHKSLNLEREVRAVLQKELVSSVDRAYGRFWERYHELDKGKGKTVKYTSSELSAIIANL